jgi:predicted ATP-grasp superfamily ATP-dependent carboligase
MMNTEKKVLVLVEAPGGPKPAFYARILPDFDELHVICVNSADSTAVKARLAPLEGATSLTIVDDPKASEAVIEDVARRVGAGGIVALSERIVHTAMNVAHRLGLRANPPDVQTSLYDKLAQRRALAAGGVATPRWSTIRCREDLSHAVAAVGLPAVLKPIVGMGSLSVYSIESLQQLEDIFASAVSLYMADTRVSAEPVFLLEQAWIGAAKHTDTRMGDYVSVESIMFDGQILHVAITDKFPLAPPFRETGHMQPSALSSPMRVEVEHEAARAIKALGVLWGVTHTEIKLTADGPRIIEINGRIGGGVAEMLEMSRGYRLIDELCHSLFGKRPSEPPTASQYAVFLTPQPPLDSKRVVKAPSVEELAQLPAIRDAEVVSVAGSATDWRLGTTSNLLRAFACNPDRETVMNTAKWLISNTGYEFE